MSINNVNYKNIVFTRSDGIYVNFKVNLNNPSDLDENFLVLTTEKINKPMEIRLFYWLDKKRWTINELQFFALNNSLCMTIYDKAGTELTSYGMCPSDTRVFNKIFGINFN